MENVLRNAQTKYYTDEECALLSKATVGIAGLGGLGSNCAVMLARAGIEHFILLDYDIVEPSNLNRQFYWPSDLGQAKTSALANHLRSLNPALSLTLINKRLSKVNCTAILNSTSLWIEAFDDAQSKAMLLEETLLQNAYIVSASGICGCGQGCLKTREFHHGIIVGDFVSDCELYPPLAPRITCAAAMLADCMLAHILKKV